MRKSFKEIMEDLHYSKAVHAALKCIMTRLKSFTLKSKCEKPNIESSTGSNTKQTKTTIENTHNRTSAVLPTGKIIERSHSFYSMSKAKDTTNNQKVETHTHKHRYLSKKIISCFVRLSDAVPKHLSPALVME